MRWLRRLVIALPVLAVVLVTGLVLAPNLLRPRLEFAAQRALGRPVNVGELMLLPSWPPALQARDVAVDGLGKVARVQAVMAPELLFSRHPQVRMLRLIGADLAVSNRLPSFTMKRLAAPAAAASGAEVPAADPAAPAVGRIEITDGHLSWRMSPFGLDLAVSGSSTPQAVDLTGRGTFSIGDARVPLDLHITGDPHASLTADGTAANAKLSARLAEPARALDADFSLSTPDAEPLGTALGLHLPRGALQVQAHVAEPARELGNRLALDRLALNTDAGDLAGTVTIAYGGRADVRGTLASKHLNLAALLAALHAQAPSKAAVAPAPPAAPSSPPETLLSGRPFAFPDRFNADLQLSVAAADWGKTPLGAVVGHLVLQAGRLTLDPLTITPPGGRPIAVAFRMGGADPAGLTPAGLTLNAPSVPLQTVLELAGLPSLASGEAMVNADLHARGATLDQLAASLDGHALVHADNAEIDSALFASVLRAAHLPLPPAVLGPRIRVRCLGLGFDAQRGVLALAPMVADAELVRIEGAGTIDLGGQTLALRLRPLLRAGPGLVVPVRVDGSLRAPHVASDTGGRWRPPRCKPDRPAVPSRPQRRPRSRNCPSRRSCCVACGDEAVLGSGGGCRNR